MLTLYTSIFFIAGMCIFSFLGVVAYRLPKHISFVEGRSFCPSCGNKLKWYDMFPVLSWVVLGGKCRVCKSRIPAVYPLSELLGGILATVTLFHYGEWNGYWYALTPQALLMFAVICIVSVIAVIDYNTMEIPNGLVIALLLPAVLAIFLFPDVSLLSRVIGFFSVSLPLLLITILIPGAFGGGDIKLFAAAGFLLGWKLCLTAFFVSIFAGGAYGIYLLLSRKKSRKEHFAFGPAICLGIIVTIFWGQALLNWYINLIF